MATITLLLHVAIAVVRASDLEFRGIAAPFAQGLTSVERYAVTSCAHAGVGQCGECAQVWCDVGCASTSRPVVRMARQCVDCELADLVLSRDVFQQLAGDSGASLSVGWTCVDCGPDIVDFIADDVDLETVLQAVCFTVNNSDGDQLVTGSRVHHGGGESFTNWDHSIPVDGGVSNSKIVGNLTSGSLDTEEWGVHDEQTAASFPGASTPIPPPNSSPAVWPSPPLFPSVAPPSTSPPDNSSGGEPPSRTPTTDPSITDRNPLESPPVSSSSTSSSSETGTVSFDDEKEKSRRDSLASPGSTSGGNSTAKATAPTTPPISPTPRSNSADTSSSGESFSSTSSVLKSPDFYASVVLAIVGLFGVIVGQKAKHKRNRELEAMVHGASTPSASPSAPMSPQA